MSHTPRLASLSLGSLATLTLLTWPRAVHAGGYEFATVGTRALGRGGAFGARADEPLAAEFDPAMLTELPGLQLQLDTHLAFLTACYARGGAYGDALDMPEQNFDAMNPLRFGPSDQPPPNGYQGVPRPEVCNEAPLAPIPALALSWRPTRSLGFAFSVLPPAAVGARRFGSVDDMTVSASGAANGRMPSPARYMVAEEQVLLVWPSLSVGYRATPWLALGATWGFGIARMAFLNATRAIAGTDFAGDIRTNLVATDPFVPRATIAVHLTPIDALDVSLAFTWTDDVKADGRLELTSGIYQRHPVEERVPSADCSGSADRCDRGPIEGVRLRAPMPWKARFALRYADRISPRPEDPADVERLSGRTEDAMANERWDLELDVEYTAASRVEDFVISIPDGASLQLAGIGDTPLPRTVVLPHRWQDQWAFRLGGDYNLIPGMAAVRAGLSYETRGLDPAYAQLDFMPFERIGLHTGLTLRIGKFDVSLAYAHYFQESITVREADVEEPSVGTACPSDEATRPGCVVGGRFEGGRGVPQVTASAFGGSPKVVNQGTFSGDIDLLSVGLRYRF